MYNTTYTKMYDLPTELINYIFSFDCNTYNKQKFSEVMRELSRLYSWRRTQKFLYYKYSTYDIYFEYNQSRSCGPALSVSQYILSVSAKFGDCVIVDDMRWIFEKKKHLGEITSN